MATDNLSLRYDNLGNVITPIAEGLGNYAFNNLLGDDSNLGGGFGTLFAQGASTALGKMASNLYKGLSLFEGVKQNAGESLAGAGVGLLSNWTGRGITSAMGDSRLGRSIGSGTATALGIYGGNLVSRLLGKNTTVNPYGAAMSIAGTALGAATGPSKEYGGTYGNITRIMDSVYDVATAGANFLPGGQVISGAMSLHKGLSNVFGSTDGMTKLDAILGSAFMPFFVKWGNMIGAKKTDKFRDLSWLNLEKANSFMLNSFGDLGKKFEEARENSERVFGGGYRFLGFRGNRNKFNAAQDNINFANDAWGKILSMADERELENIRSLYMSSINNQKYSLMINGGFYPIYSGKQGMKILNNATNHNVGLRLLSAAALIDNKVMILCNAHD